MRVFTGGIEEHNKAYMAPVPTTANSKVEATGRLPSIEMEPKTLTLDQIKYAREAALYVVSTKSEEEAMRIFTAGLKPVQVRAARKSGSSVDSSDDDVDLDGGFCDGAGANTGRRGRRTSMDDIRDIATAPF